MMRTHCFCYSFLVALYDFVYKDIRHRHNHILLIAVREYCELTFTNLDIYDLYYSIIAAQILPAKGTTDCNSHSRIRDMPILFIQLFFVVLCMPIYAKVGVINHITDQPRFLPGFITR